MDKQEKKIIEQLTEAINGKEGNKRYEAIQHYKAFLEATILRKQLQLLGAKEHSAG